MQKIFGWIMGAAAMAAAGPAYSATIFRTTTVDLDPSMINLNGHLQAPLPGPNVALNVGDVLNWTIDFANGERLKVSNSVEAPVGQEWILAFLTPTSGTANATFSFSFLGVQGSYANPTLTGSYSGIIGFSAVTNYTDSAFTFTGVNAVITYTSGTASSFTPGQLQVARGIASIEAPVQGVPEPKTWAMMVLGLGAAATVLRRRQRRTVRYDFA